MLHPFPHNLYSLSHTRTVTYVFMKGCLIYCLTGFHPLGERNLHSFIFVIHFHSSWSLFIIIFISRFIYLVICCFFAFCLFFPSSCPLLGMVDIPATLRKNIVDYFENVLQNWFWLQGNCFLLADKHSVVISVSTLKRWCKKLHLVTRKKHTNLAGFVQNEMASNGEMQEYWQYILLLRGCMLYHKRR